ncbi:hypothetical protein HQ865_01320 [Mucilaginibacter mali]|uniref:Uncharacterized protein n=1 Tax=Mucilaginibacter mali TaxID=2740462 RepID=A0A7D4TSN3_9SPHI|nr:hypothetical protein [Mucilaginibacter mali]QKJ28455.1 hypothetical protein HQ865_01320 [Mucilaginibacter mali]
MSQTTTTPTTRDRFLAGEKFRINSSETLYYDQYTPDAACISDNDRNYYCSIRNITDETFSVWGFFIDVSINRTYNFSDLNFI